MRAWNKLRSLFGRRIDADLAEEMELHRAMLEERYREEGLSPEEARHRAAREFGPGAAAVEDSRAEWSFPALESIWIDVRYAMRALYRNKAFAATAVLTPGIGLALASAAFADVVHGWMFDGIDRTCIYLPVSETNAKRAAETLVLLRGDEDAGLRALVVGRAARLRRADRADE